MRLSIRAQILFACLATVLPLAAVEGYFLLDHYRSERREAVADALREAQAIASAAAAFMVNLQSGALAIAEEAGLVGGDPRRIQPILERLVRATKSQAYVLFILPGGRGTPWIPAVRRDQGVFVFGGRQPLRHAIPTPRGPLPPVWVR